MRIEPLILYNTADAAISNVEMPVEAPAPVETPVEAPTEAAEAEVEPQATEAPPARPKGFEPLISEITGLRAKNREKDAEIERLRRAEADARALADRLAKGDKPDSAPTPRFEPTPPASNFEEAVEKAANYKMFVTQVEGVRDRGVREFGTGFNDAIRSLSAVGADNDAFVQGVLDVAGNDAHKLLNDLAGDLEKTHQLVNMSPTKRIAELTRMAIQAGNKTTTEPARAAAPGKAVSKAPPPAPALQTSTSKTVDWRSDDASDEDFNRGFEDMMKRRNSRR